MHALGFRKRPKVHAGPGDCFTRPGAHQSKQDLAVPSVLHCETLLYQVMPALSAVLCSVQLVRPPHPTQQKYMGIPGASQAGGTCTPGCHRPARRTSAQTPRIAARRPCRTCLQSHKEHHVPCCSETGKHPACTGAPASGICMAHAGLSGAFTALQGSSGHQGVLIVHHYWTVFICSAAAGPHHGRS